MYSPFAFLFEETEETEDTDIWELLEGIDGLETYSSDGMVWIGRSWTDIADDETGLQFKQKTEKMIEERLGPGLKIKTHSETIYN